MTSNIDEPLQIHYHDGRPEIEKADIAKDIKKELHKDNEPENDADIAKSALYANTPKAKAKMDKSLNARAINSMLESFNRRRNETNFELSRLKMLNAPYCLIYADRAPNGIARWVFKWVFKDSKIVTDTRPENGYGFEWKSPKLAKFDENMLPEIYKKLEEHIKRVKS